MMFKLLIIMSFVTSALAVAEYYVECPAASMNCYGMLSAFSEKNSPSKKK